MGDDLIHRRELSSSSILGCTLLQEPVIEETKTPSNIAWEYHSVTLSRVPGYGFGIAVSGGRDNPHFANGDPAIAISDVLKSGPAEGKLMVNDRILSANGVSLETVDYATAVQVLRDNSTVQLVVKRRVVLQEGSTVRVSLSRKEGAGGGTAKKDFGLVLSTRLYIKDMTLKTGSIGAGDVILKINNTSTDGMSVKEARRLIEATKDKLQLVIKREEQREEQKAYSTQNLYVQPPRRPDFGGGQRDYVPPRPPPPQEDDGQLAQFGQMALESLGYQSAPRHVSFVKHGSVGIRLAGGNAVGIYVTAVQPGSPASTQGLMVGDQILKVNNRDLMGMTREEAVELLMSLTDTVDLLVQSKLESYKKITEESVGDNYYVRCNYEHGGFKPGDILNITDSLSGGGMGEWLAVNLRTGVRGGVPNAKRGRELIKKKGAEPYARVELKRVEFLRPVVIWGAGAEWARAELSKEPGFQIPALDSSKTFKLSNIREIINTGHHALLDINPAAVEKLNSANLPPIVLFLDMSKDLLRELRNRQSSGWRSLTGRSLKKMMEAGTKLEKVAGHLVSAKLSLTSGGESWVGRIVSGVEREQGVRVWVGVENKPQENYDYLFPPAQPHRSSYAEDSDPEPVLPNYTAPPPYALTTYVQEVYSTRLSTPKTMNNQHPPLAHSPTESEPPPQVDRTKKPKSATERLFGDPNRNYYECQHDVYRFTRSTVQGRFENGSSAHGGTPPGLPYLNGSMNGSILPGPIPLNYESPYLQPPPPKVKPVPPPKPAKPLRSAPRGNDSGFYLNVPITLGNRELSAFELYRKEGSSALVEVSPEAGGRLEVEGVRLYLPPRAVKETTSVRMTVYEGEGDPRLLTPLVKLEPEGLILLQPGTLYLPQSTESTYDNWQGVTSGNGVVELSIGQF